MWRWNSRSITFSSLWTTQPAILILNCLMYSLCDSHQTPQMDLNPWTKQLWSVKCKLRMQSLPAKTDIISSANGLAKPISILDAVIWTVEVKKQTSPQTLQSSSQKAWFSTDYVNDEERNESKSMNSRRQSDTYENTEEKVMWTLIMKMKQELLQRKSTSSLRTTSKVRKRKMRTKEEEEDTFQKWLEECKLKSYDDAHKNITELQGYSLTQNNSKLSDIICRVSILIENQASEPLTCRKPYCTTGNNEQCV